MADFLAPGTYSYSASGSNTLTQVSADPTTLYHVSISHQGGSVGYLQIYNNGSADAGAGTPTFTVAVQAGTGAAGTPDFEATRDVMYGPSGRIMSAGLSYLWAAGATGTVAHGVNAIVDISYRGTIT